MDQFKYTEKILEFISSAAYIPLKAHDLFTLISDGEQDGSEYDAFLKSLSALEREGMIVYTKNGKLMPSSDGNHVKGSYISSERGFGFVEYQDEKSGLRERVFIPAPHTLGAVYGDVVLCSITSRASSSDKCDEGRIVRVLERTLKNVIGVVRLRRSSFRARKFSLYVVPDNKKVGFNILIKKTSFPVEPGDKVEVTVNSYPQRSGDNAYGTVTQVFGKSDTLGANYQAILHSNDIRTEFPDEVTAEADAVARRPIKYEGREDLRNSLIFTIDGADAKDLDDAISLDVTENGYILGVHIADVSDYVCEGSALDREAMLRGTSVYFTDKVVPMLPRALSNGICSLNGGVDRQALSVFIELDSDGNTLGCTLKESVIRSCVRGVYSEINDIFDKGRESEFYGKYSHVDEAALQPMRTLYEKLEANGRRRGALEFDTADAMIILDGAGNPVDVVRRERGISERMIEQFMLCANEAVANWLYWQSMPCVYRVHETPAYEKLRAFTTFAHNLGLDTSSLKAKTIHPSALQRVLIEANGKDIATTVSYVMLRSLAKARYSAQCAPHFGLASDRYCHFTSPIRRYPDLSVHRIIKAVLHGEMDSAALAHYSSFSERSAKMSSENELKALFAEREIEDLYRMLFMRDKVGCEFDAVISSVTSFGLFAELDNTCEGLIPIASLEGGYYEFDERSFTLSCGENIFSLGMRIRVRVEDVDVGLGKMELSLVSPYKKAKGDRYGRKK